MKLSMTMAVLAVGFWLGTGCATERAGQAFSPDKVDLLGKGVRQSVVCSGLRERVLEDGRLEVTAKIRNQLNRRIEVQISCVFKDELGFPTMDEAPFRTLILTEKVEEGVRFVSLNDQARDYTIRIREAR